MPDFGRQVLSTQIGNGLMALFHMDDARAKPGGITVDWTTVTAVTGSDVTLPDYNVVTVGQKAMRYGQIVCEITSGGTAGQYGPFDTNATDGRQTLTRGKCFILNQTVIQNGNLPGLLVLTANQMGNVYDAGTFWQARLIVDTLYTELTGNPAGPSTAAFEAAFPGVRYAIV